MCTEAGCQQREPPLPSDGEWECRDELGALVCRGGEPPAGVREGPRDPGFECARRAAGDEVCVALDPVAPPAGPHRCLLEHEHGELRRCTPDSHAARLLQPCDAAHACPTLLSCRIGRCLPPLGGDEACWLDADCSAGVCVLGRCST